MGPPQAGPSFWSLVLPRSLLGPQRPLVVRLGPGAAQAGPGQKGGHKGPRAHRWGPCCLTGALGLQGTWHGARGPLAQGLSVGQGCWEEREGLCPFSGCRPPRNPEGAALRRWAPWRPHSPWQAERVTGFGVHLPPPPPTCPQLPWIPAPLAHASTGARAPAPRTPSPTTAAAPRPSQARTVTQVSGATGAAGAGPGPCRRGWEAGRPSAAGGCRVLCDPQRDASTRRAMSTWSRAIAGPE